MATDYEKALDDIIAEAERVPAGREGDYLYERIQSAGIQASEETDARYWFIGGLGNLLLSRYGKGPGKDSKYGKNVIGTFAFDIQTGKRKVYEFVAVCGFYPDFARRALLNECATLKFAHFEVAMRLGKHFKKKHGLNAYDVAIDYLNECHRMEWGPDEAEAVALERMGKPRPPQKVFEANATLQTVKQVRNEPTLVVLEVPAGADVKELVKHAGKELTLKVFETQSEAATVAQG